MSVLLPDRSSRRAPSSCRRRLERDALQHRLPSLYSNHTLSNATSPTSGRLRRASRPPGSRWTSRDFADAIEAGERLGDLRADRGDADERRGHDADEEDVGNQVAERHLPAITA
jgi:hypothetical protein